MSSINAKRDVIIVSLLYFSIAIIIFYSYLFKQPQNLDSEFYVTLSLLFLIGTVSTVLFSFSIVKQGISANSIFWFFSYWFFFVVPVLHLLMNSFDWVPIRISKIPVALTVILWLSSYCLVYYNKRVLPNVAQKPSSAKVHQWDVSYGRLFIITGVSLLWFIYYASLYDYIIVFLRLPFGVDFVGPQSMYLLTGYFIRPLFIIAFLVVSYKFINTTNKTRSQISWIVYYGLLAFLTNLPTAVPRFYVFAAFLAVLISLFKSSRQGLKMAIVLLCSMTASSILHLFRGIRDEYDIKERFSFDYLVEGHFPSFELLSQAIEFVDKNGIQYGQQLLGTVLFWVPRVLWPDKPIGSSKFLVDNFLNFEKGLVLTNVSMPAVAEVYLDAHLLGVVVGGCFFGWLAKKLDLYLKLQISSESGHPNVILVSYLIGLWLFVQRGDLMAAFSFVIGITCAFFTIKYIVLNSPTKNRV